MADELFGGVLGSEDEKSEAEVPQTPLGAEAFAAATAERLSASDAGVARDTSVFLQKQAQLLELQAQHLRDEHASRLLHLRLAVSAAKRKRYADRIRNTLYTFIALLVLGVLVAAVRMTVEAMSDHGLVVESFTVPPDLTARGATGEALAEELASRVAIIRATAARASLDEVAQVRADQAGSLKVQIPETGISVDDLDRMMQATAERTFEMFSPENFIQYLEVTGRSEDAWNTLERHVHSPQFAALARADRADFYSLYAYDDPDRHRALSSALISIDIDPRVLVTWRAAAIVNRELGHDQAALDLYRKTLTMKQQDLPPSQRGVYAFLLDQAHYRIDSALGNFAALQGDDDVIDGLFPPPLNDHYAENAVVAAALHDVPRSRQQLARAQAAGPSDLAVLQAQWFVSSGAGDWPQALVSAQALVANGAAQKAAAPNPEFAARPELALATQYRPLLAYAEAMTGDTASATALISQTPTDCYLCVRTRARIAAAAGDPTTADRWFAEAVRQAPDLPAAYLEWGQALAARGDLAGAAREFTLAQAKGPHFAAPLKGWGDVLAKQGRPKQALVKYDEALKDAPNWTALHVARDAAQD